MYQLLKTDDYISTNIISQNLDKDASISGRARLQARIKEVCTGHLRWCFRDSVFLARQSWPAPSKTESDTDEPDDKPRAKFFVGSLEMLKLFEFSRVFEGEGKLVKGCLDMGTTFMA